jgi:glycosyltransferase involved in cell wall biosynthesis
LKEQKTILFIGSFPKIDIGGTSSATGLLAQSDAFKTAKIIKVDSTLKSISSNYWLGRILRAARRFIQLNWIVLSKRPNVALVFCGHGAGFIEKGSYVRILKQLGVPSVLAPRSGILLQNLENKSFKKFATRVFKNATYIICQGEYWQRKFLDFAPKDKLVVVPNWVKTPSQEEKVKPNKPNLRIIYMGWFEEYKGIKTLLNASKLLTDKSLNFELLLYGNGSMEKEMQEFITNNKLGDKVHLKGWVSGEQKKEALSNADLLLLASEFEGMPNTVLEAMSYGIPVIANATSTIPEIIKHKETGMLFYNQNEEELVHHIQELMSDEALRKKLSVNGRKRVEQQHQIEPAAHKILQLLDKA